MKKDFSIIRELRLLKLNMKNGIVSYDEAKEEAKPLIKKFNEVSKEVAKKHGCKPKYISFSGFMR